MALKIASPDISHKTDVGGVSLGVTSPTEVARIAGDMLARVRQHRPDAAIHGLMVQPMAPPGKELLLGALRDPQFGPLVVVGLGGIYVEVLRDTATRLAPVSPAEAVRMLDELRMAPLLRGVRGEPAVDQAALAVDDRALRAACGGLSGARRARAEPAHRACYRGGGRRCSRGTRAPVVAGRVLGNAQR